MFGDKFDGFEGLMADAAAAFLAFIRDDVLCDDFLKLGVSAHSVAVSNDKEDKSRVPNLLFLLLSSIQAQI